MSWAWSMGNQVHCYFYYYYFGGQYQSGSRVWEEDLNSGSYEYTTNPLYWRLIAEHSQLINRIGTDNKRRRKTII